MDTEEKTKIEREDKVATKIEEKTDHKVGSLWKGGNSGASGYSGIGICLDKEGKSGRAQCQSYQSTWKSGNGGGARPDAGGAGARAFRASTGAAAKQRQQEQRCRSKASRVAER